MDPEKIFKKIFQQKGLTVDEYVNLLKIEIKEMSFKERTIFFTYLKREKGLKEILGM